MTENLLRDRARAMRREPTDAERRMWSLLRDRRFGTFKFRRQETIGPYIVDFVCYDARVIAELDGSRTVRTTWTAMLGSPPAASPSCDFGTARSCATRQCSTPSQPG